MEFALDGLIAIGDAGEGDRFRPPVGASEPVAEEFGRAVFDEHLGFEVEAGGEAEVFVVRPGVAVAAAVRAAAVGIHAIAEADVGAVVLGDDGLRIVGQVLRGRAVELGQVLFVVGHLLEVGFEAVRDEADWPAGCAAPRPLGAGPLGEEPGGEVRWSMADGSWECSGEQNLMHQYCECTELHYIRLVYGDET